MRLICPNCDAQYEVSDDAIPAEGRDVQCSNCGHGWFQRPSAIFSVPLPAAAPEEAPPATAPPAWLSETPLPQSDPTPSLGTPESGRGPDPADEDPPGEDDDEAAAQPAAVAPPSRSLDEGLLAVLREEAEREAEQRRREGAGETVIAPLPDPSVLPDQRPALAQVVAFQPPAAPPMPQAPLAEPMPRPRRDLLPDIEEINSTLRSSVTRPGAGDEPAPPPRPSRASYRAGFFLMIVVALLLATGYLMAPQIAAEMPGAEPALRRYVAAVDEARLLLDRLLQTALQAVQDAAS
ncbi:zinc-ribbon domain-containing protein [Cereibacter sphaeroides]|uniref:zinc-ribbon domain-containing protein n=1 Tax=Cereibacter sphaeroides TaxID=1063 RepID=UPI001F346CF3|nr:zinc-ribbon domain-containing protein [Cereibacter sphaeroides]MCE6959471.1 zinc-ribbon domain-containing protein [Cereibacter sphaeroides]MCE6973758.1 zinc-ribbon domain-containing protein [Cereibacter sphaeroides]